MAKKKAAKKRRPYKKPAVIKTDITFTDKDLDIKGRLAQTGHDYTVSYTKDYTVDYNKSEVV